MGKNRGEAGAQREDARDERGGTMHDFVETIDDW